MPSERTIRRIKLPPNPNPEPTTYSKIGKASASIEDLERGEQISWPSSEGYPATGMSKTDDAAMRGLASGYDKFGKDMLHADHYNGEAFELEASRKAEAARAEYLQKITPQGHTERLDELQQTVNQNPALRRL